MQGGGEAGPLKMEAGASAPSPVTSVDGVCAELQVVDPAGEGVTPEAVEETRQVIADRLAATGVAAPTIRAERSDRIVLVLPEVVPGSEADTALRDLVVARGVVRFLAVPTELQGQVAEGPVPAAMDGVAPILDGSDVAGASVGDDPATRQVVIDLVLTEEGGRLFDEFAAAHLGEQIAIVADDTVLSAPTLNAAAFEGQVQVSGTSRPTRRPAWRRSSAPGRCRWRSARSAGPVCEERGATALGLTRPAHRACHPWHTPATRRCTRGTSQQDALGPVAPRHGGCEVRTWPSTSRPRDDERRRDRRALAPAHAVRVGRPERGRPDPGRDRQGRLLLLGRRQALPRLQQPADVREHRPRRPARHRRHRRPGAEARLREPVHGARAASAPRRRSSPS